MVLLVINMLVVLGINVLLWVLLSDYLCVLDDDDIDVLYVVLVVVVGGILVVLVVELMLWFVIVFFYVCIEFVVGMVLNVKVGFKCNDCLINIIDVFNVIIIGNGVIVVMFKFEYCEGE